MPLILNKNPCNQIWNSPNKYPKPEIKRSILTPGKQQKDCLSLKHGEEICSICEGTGRDVYWHDNLLLKAIPCRKCHGEGKLDWVKNMTWNLDNDTCCTSAW